MKNNDIIEAHASLSLSLPPSLCTLTLARREALKMDDEIVSQK
jgi:hypothetical protein